MQIMNMQISSLNKYMQIYSLIHANFLFTAGAGGVDEDSFMQAFEDVPKLHVSDLLSCDWLKTNY